MPVSKSTFGTMSTHATSSILNNHPHPHPHPHLHGNTLSNSTKSDSGNDLSNSGSMTAFHPSMSKKKNIPNNEPPTLLSRSNTISSPSPLSATSPSTAVSSSMSSPNESLINDVILNDHEIKPDNVPASNKSPQQVQTFVNNPSSTYNGKNPSSWDPQDDLLLRHLKEVKKLGWKDISQFFNNRTPNACQFRWRRLKSGNLKSNKTALVNVTDYQGVIKALKEGRLNDFLVPATEPTKLENNDTKIIVQDRMSMNNDLISPKKKNEGVVFKNYANENNDASTSGTNYQSAVSNATSPSKEVYASKFIATNNLSFGPNGDLVGNQENANHVQETFNKQSKVQNKIAHLEQLKTHSNISSSHSNTNSKKFAKPRSFSHSVTRPKLNTNMRNTTTNFNNGMFNNGTSNNAVGANEDENVGFIPKIIVRSRRSSLAVPVLQQNQNPNMLSPSTSFTNIANALNTTLVTSKSRKNSISLMSRRSSFNITSGPSSRKHSIISAAVSNSIANQFPMATQAAGDVHLNIQAIKHRKDSVHRKDFHSNIINNNSHPEHSFPSTFGFVDTPQTTVTRKLSLSATGLNSTANKENSPSQTEWTRNEDEILLQCQERNLSFKEMSILLNNKTENDTQWRLSVLRSQNNGSKDQIPESDNVDPLHISHDAGIKMETGSRILSQSTNHLPSINNILNDMN